MQILCSLSSAISQGYKNCRMHSTQTHLNVNCTKTQCSVTVTLIKLIRNKSPLQYLAVRSCILYPVCAPYGESRNIGLHLTYVDAVYLNVISLIPCWYSMILLLDSLFDTLIRICAIYEVMNVSTESTVS